MKFKWAGGPFLYLTSLAVFPERHQAASDLCKPCTVDSNPPVAVRGDSLSLNRSDDS